jgi:hypothetical protein
VEIWYILSRFGILYQEKSGNPDNRRSLWTGWAGKKCIQALAAWSRCCVTIGMQIHHLAALLT